MKQSPTLRGLRSLRLPLCKANLAFPSDRQALPWRRCCGYPRLLSDVKALRRPSPFQLSSGKYVILHPDLLETQPLAFQVLSTAQRKTTAIPIFIVALITDLRPQTQTHRALHKLFSMFQINIQGSQTSGQGRPLFRFCAPRLSIPQSGVGKLMSLVDAPYVVGSPTCC